MGSLIKPKKAKRIARIVEDAGLFAESLLGLDLWSKQQEILRSIAVHARTAVKACHASGKSFMAAVAVLWFITRYREAIALTTAPTWMQVERVLAKIRECSDEEPLEAGIDVAGPGEDETTLFVRRGRRIVLSRFWNDPDPRGKLVAELAPFKAKRIKVKVDSAGSGYYLGQHLKDNGFEVVMVNVGESPGDAEKFANLKAELYWGLRMRAQAGDLAGLTDEKTIGQLAGIRYKHNARGQVVIESKEEARKRGVKSPDRAEGLMLAFAERHRPGIMDFYEAEVEKMRSQSPGTSGWGPNPSGWTANPWDAVNNW